MDQQIKVRGVRIEPQGVEAALNGHPEVAESLVRGLEDLDGKKRLVAYVAISPEGADARDPALTRRLRTHLERRSPASWCPTRSCFWTHCPVPPAGNSTSPPCPFPISSVALEAIVRGPPKRVEEALAQIWERVLQLERVGIDDDFLHIGGDSLSATRIVAASITLSARPLAARLL